MTTHAEHNIPTFGCIECINNDKQAADKLAFDSWHKQYRFPKCPVCGGPTKAWEYESSGKQLEIIIGCADDNAAERACSDEDFSVKIPL